MGVSRAMSRAKLEVLFDRPVEQAARALGVSGTIVKRLCRRYGIPKWPFRQLTRLDAQIAKKEEGLADLQRAAAAAADGNDGGGLRRHQQALAAQLQSIVLLRAQRAAVFAGECIDGTVSSDDARSASGGSTRSTAAPAPRKQRRTVVAAAAAAAAAAKTAAAAAAGSDSESMDEDDELHARSCGGETDSAADGDGDGGMTSADDGVSSLWGGSSCGSTRDERSGASTGRRSSSVTPTQLAGISTGFHFSDSSDNGNIKREGGNGLGDFGSAIRRSRHCASSNASYFPSAHLLLPHQAAAAAHAAAATAAAAAAATAAVRPMMLLDALSSTPCTAPAAAASQTRRSNASPQLLLPLQMHPLQPQQLWGDDLTAFLTASDGDKLPAPSAAPRLSCGLHAAPTTLTAGPATAPSYASLQLLDIGVGGGGGGGDAAAAMSSPVCLLQSACSGNSGPGSSGGGTSRADSVNDAELLSCDVLSDPDFWAL